jgi:hypothetical protein
VIRALAAFAIAWAISATAVADVQRAPLEVGQVWTIKNAPVPETQVMISLIEPYGTTDSAVHVGITGAGLGTLPNGGVFNGEILHLPFERSALEQSLGELVATDRIPGPEFHAAYQQWKQAKGGLFNVGVADAIGLVFETLEITPMKRSQ